RAPERAWSLWRRKISSLTLHVRRATCWLRLPPSAPVRKSCANNCLRERVGWGIAACRALFRLPAGTVPSTLSRPPGLHLSGEFTHAKSSENWLPVLPARRRRQPNLLRSTASFVHRRTMPCFLKPTRPATVANLIHFSERSNYEQNY